MGQIEDLPVPRTRGGHRTQLFERYHRRRDELDTAIGQMYVDGVSMAKVGQVVETLTGSKPAHRRSLASSTPLRASIKSGNTVSWKSAMRTHLPMGPISR